MNHARTLLSSRYRVTGLLGRGGMADVYAAVDEVLQRPVAVKVLRDATGDGTLRFTGEMHALARLNHPSVVRLYDAGAHDGHPYLVMECVDGTSLRALLRGGSMPLARVHPLALDLAEGLTHAHDRGVVHRDVKPSNVLLEVGGAARLTDFGIASLAEAGGAGRVESSLGTAGYMAPEQLDGRQGGYPVDVYALGLVLLEALSGTRAFPGAGIAAAVTRLERDPVVPASLPQGWRDLLAAMTARDPGRRPSALEVTHWLRDGPPVPPAAVLASEPGSGSRLSRALQWASLAAVLAAAVALTA